MYKWYGKCAVCQTVYEHETEENIPPFHKDGKSYGCFCPTCRDKKLMALGVVHFTYMQLCNLDEEEES